MGGSWELGRGRCAAFSTSRTKGSKCLHLTFVYGGRASCVIDRSQVRRQPGESANTETTTVHPTANVNLSIPEPRLIPKGTLETSVAIQPEEVATEADEIDDKETIPPSSSTIVNYQWLKHLWTKCLLTNCKPRRGRRSGNWRREEDVARELFFLMFFSVILFII